MKKFLSYILLAVMLAAPLAGFAKKETDVADHYRRSSLCSILVSHSEDQYAKEIKEQFLEIPIPDKFNDHDLNIKVVSVDSKGKYDNTIHKFVENNRIGSRLLAKWFNRDILTGQCDQRLIMNRAFLDASVADYQKASLSARGTNLIVDGATDELINNTYLMMNEVTYIDKNKRARTAGAAAHIGLSILGAVAAKATGNNSFSDLGNLAGAATNAVVSTIKGFSVKIHTRLYRLVWDDETAATFYQDYYSAVPDDARKDAFEKNRHKFKMEYVGDITSKGGTTSFLGINEDEPGIMVRKACTRAIDENIADLQKKYEQFRIKTPITSVEPTIQAQIGLREGLTKNSRYEVLECQTDKNGKVFYKRVGVVRPVANRIWDNRFMAQEEMAYGADFGATTFVKVSGGDLYPGLLLREITK